MDKELFEGSLILEKLNERGLLDSFFEKVDGDDFSGAAQIMRQAGIDDESIAIVIDKMKDADGTH